MFPFLFSFYVVVVGLHLLKILVFVFYSFMVLAWSQFAILKFMQRSNAPQFQNILDSMI